MATPIQALFFYLATPIDATQTSIPVRGLKDSRGNAITSMPAGAILIYATIEPRSGSNQEIISFSGITDNGNGQVTLTGCVRNLNPQPPFSALAGVVPHGNNAECILSNSPAFYNTFVTTDANYTITGIWTFAVSPIVPTPTTDYQASTKKYVDDLYASVITNAVLLTGNQSIAGIKTFGSSPQVPTGSVGNDAVNYAQLIATAFGGAFPFLCSQFEITYDSLGRIYSLYDATIVRTYYITYRTDDIYTPYIVDIVDNYAILNYGADGKLLTGSKL